MKQLVIRTGLATAAAVGLALAGAGVAAAAPQVTAWDLGPVTAVQVNAPGQFCVTAPQGLPVLGYSIIPKVLLPPIFDGVGGVTVVCVPGSGGPADVVSGIGFTPLF